MQRRGWGYAEWLAAGVALEGFVPLAPSARLSINLGAEASRSLAHACGSRWFSASCNRENSLLGTGLDGCKLQRMQSLTVIKRAFLLVHAVGAEGPGLVL